MKKRMLFPFLLALLAGALSAQSCPHERVRTIPSSLTFQLLQDCGGVKFRAPGLEIDTGAKGCPLFAIYTPEHDVAEPATTETKVETTAVVTELILHFACEKDWWILIPIGTVCVHTGITNGGVLERKRTVACGQAGD